MAYDKKSFHMGLASGLVARGTLYSQAQQEQLDNALYITFSSEEPFSLSTNNNTKNWDGELKYSTNTQTWSTWNGIEQVQAAYHAGQYYLYLCGIGNHIITGQDENFGTKWILQGDNLITCDGDIRALLNYADVDATSMDNYCFYGLFHNCMKLKTAPSLPSVDLADGCYAWMFYGCANLTNLPELPALSLEKYCYYYMFYGCSLIKLSTNFEDYQTTYTIPANGEGTTAEHALTSMFLNTGGTFTGTPNINTTYYTSNQIV